MFLNLTIYVFLNENTVIGKTYPYGKPVLPYVDMVILLYVGFQVFSLILMESIMKT